MKKLNKIIVVFALLATSFSSCNDNDVPVNVAVGAGNGGVWVGVSI